MAVNKEKKKKKSKCDLLCDPADSDLAVPQVKSLKIREAALIHFKSMFILCVYKKKIWEIP